MVRFGAVTLEKLLLIFVLLWKKLQNGRIWPIISEQASLILTNYSALIDIWVGIINLSFVLRLLKGRCYGNQLIWGLLQKLNLTASSFALAFWNGMQLLS